LPDSTGLAVSDWHWPRRQSVLRAAACARCHCPSDLQIAFQRVQDGATPRIDGAWREW